MRNTSLVILSGAKDLYIFSDAGGVQRSFGTLRMTAGAQDHSRGSGWHSGQVTS
jgi:hypothetical protein